MSTDPAEAKNHLLGFREELYGVTSDGRQRPELAGISSNLCKAIEQLATGLYEKELHFVLELIQNAEDNEYGRERPELRFVLMDEDPTRTPGADGCLCVYNNETGFRAAHVESICQIGKSTKTKRSGYIGEKGIGFKSVFLVSATPHIFSNGYSFHFREDDPDIPLSYVVPYWVEEVPEVVAQEGMTTALLLPLKPGKRAEVERELGAIEPETILFLEKLDALGIELDSGSRRRELRRDPSRRPIVALSITRESGAPESRTYWVQRATVKVPEDLVEEKRRGVDDREVAVAFPIENGDCQGRVFAFLPTEVRSGLPFLINADFLLTSNRESIQRDRPWNRWLRDCLAAPVLDGLRAMRARGGLRKSWYRYLPLPDQLRDMEDFFTPLCEGVTSALARERCVLAEDGTWVLPEEARLASEQERKLLAGDPLPEFLRSVYLVEPTLQRFARQLRALGVRDLSTDEFRLCLSDRKWLQTREPRWFVALYRYLHAHPEGYRTHLKTLPILPTNEGAVTSRSEAQVFLPESEMQVRALAERQRGDVLPKVVLLHPEVASSCNEDPNLYGWLRRSFGLERFSVSRYVDKSLVPWMRDHAGEIGDDTIWEGTALVAAFWNDLDEDAKRSLKDMPVVLVDGEEGLEEGERVVPARFDKRYGWDQFLRAPEDRAHLAVLDRRYRKIELPGGADRGEFLEALGATRYPSLPKRVFRSCHQYREHPEKEYVRFVFADAPNDWTKEPEVETWVAPSFLRRAELRKDARVRRAFIRWLTKQLDSSREALRYGVMRWYYYTDRERRVDSALYWRLTRTAWIRTTRGWRRPGEVFLDSAQLRALFGSRLPYLEDELPEPVCEFLGIKKEATPQSVLDLLRELSRRGSKGDERLVVELYRYLARYGKGYEDAFRDEPLIWAPGEARSWWRTSEAVWNDAAAVMPGLYGYLEPVYGASRLRDFFLNKLGVAETVGGQELARTWAELPGRAEHEGQERIEKALGVILKALVKTLKGGPEPPEWWTEIAGDLQVWTQDGAFVDPDSVFVNDDVGLWNLFRGDLDFVWLPDGLSHRDLATVYQGLGVRRLSEAVSIDLVGVSGARPRRPPEALTDATKKLIAYLLWNDDTDRYRDLIEQGVLPQVFRAVEQIAEKLSVRYTVTGGWSVRERETSSYWGSDEQVLIVARKADKEDQLDSIAETLARLFWKRDHKVRMDHVRAILGVTTEGRLRSIRDRKGWHMPSEEMRQVEAWIAESGEQPDVGGAGGDDASSGEGGSNESDRSGGDGEPTGTGNDGAEARDDSEPGTGGAAGGSDQTKSRGGSDQTGTARGGGATGPRLRGSKSRDVTRRLNRRLQRRVVTYVEGDVATGSEGGANVEAATRDREIGKRAEDLVVQMEQSENRTAHRMPPGNPGYDIESVDRDTGSIRYIEVKGTDGDWGDLGVGLTKPQFEFARQKGEDFWLYVVERAGDASPRVHRIRNPAAQITQYRFDGNWARLAEKGSAAERADAPEAATVEELQGYTEDERCRGLIARCARNRVSVPEVGCDISGENGKVLGEVELAWEDRKLAVALPRTSEDVLEALEHDGWMVVRLGDVADVEEAWEALASKLE